MDSSITYRIFDDGKCPRCGSSDICFEWYDDYDNVSIYSCGGCGKEFYKRYKKVLDVGYYYREE